LGNKSNIAIYLREGEGGNPVKEESSIPLDQQHPKPLEQVPDGILLLLACPPGLSTCKFPEEVRRG
jgi:hypothetical protein